MATKSKTTKKPLLQANNVEWLIIAVMTVALVIGLILVLHKQMKHSTSTSGSTKKALISD